MILGFLTLLIAIAISAVSAYYSILGLVAIFAAAVLPVIVMGVVLELGKLATAVWLHRNWARAGWTYKSYLIPALLMLMLLTSMGTFGFLSKAHLDQGVPTGNVAAQIELIDTKIATQRGNIEASRKNLSQLDAAVDETLKRSTTEGGAARASQLRQRQVKDRAAIATEIETAQKSIARLQEERAVIATELRRVEAEVGPVKYVAALIYGDDTGHDLLEKAVRWVIILIVVVFDPLAIVLILAGTKQLEWGREAWRERRAKKKTAGDKVTAYSPQPPVTIQPTFTDEEWHALNQHLVMEREAKEQSVRAHQEQLDNNVALEAEISKLEASVAVIPTLEQELAKVKEERDRLWKAHGAEMQRADKLAIELEELAEALLEEQKTLSSTQETAVDVEIPAPEGVTVNGVTKEALIFHPSEGYVTFEGKSISIDALRHSRPDLLLNHTDPVNQILFGGQFPEYARTGDLYIRTDVLPHAVFKFNGNKWVSLNKTMNTTYLQYVPYVQYLIQKIDSGEYDTEMLTDYERDEIEEHLRAK